MAILAYDDVMLREPRLLVPGMQPLRSWNIDKRHSAAAYLRKLLVGTTNGTAYTKGASVTEGIGLGGKCLRVTDHLFQQTVSSAYTIDLGTRPTSATILIVGQRDRDCTTQGICLALNTRSESEANYCGVTLGNSYSTPKNAVDVSAAGGTLREVYVNGTRYASGATGRATDLSVPIAVVVTYTSMTGSEYKLFGKDDIGSAGFVSPTSIYLFAEFAVMPEPICSDLSRDPYQFLIPA